MNFKCLFKKRTDCKFVIIILTFFLICTGANAQNGITVSGVVIDDTGLTVPSANVIEKGTSNSVSTDLDGKFTIKVASQNSALVFSFIGYETITQVVGKQKKINVILKSSTNKLDEVVIGYGTVRKADLTGSVTMVSGDDLKKITLPSVAETLTGRVAGVQVTSTEGSPDSEIKIRIRGGGSLTQDSSPLYIVDGFPVNSISDISPSNIENISILKDASSTAIYGSRGANGVIIITTKNGGKDGGKVTVNYNTFYGVKKIAKTMDVLNPEDFAKWQYEYALLIDDVPSYESAFGGPWQQGQFKNAKATNWQKEIFGRDGTTQNHDLGIRGGSEKINYNFNYTSYKEDAIMIGSGFKRNNLSLNLRSKANENIDIAFTVRYSDTKISGGGTNEQNEISSADSRLKYIIAHSPIDLIGVTTDNTDEAESNYVLNPNVLISDTDRLQTRKNYNLLGSFSWKLNKNLQLKSDFGSDNYFYTDDRFYGRSTYYVKNIPASENQNLPALVSRYRVDKRFRNATTLNFDFKKLLGDKHKLKLLVGEEIINSKSTMLTNTVHGFDEFFTFQNTMNLTGLGTPQSVENFVSPDDKLISFFARANYDINNRYLLTATFRGDGSSKFLGNNKWGYFPSAAAAWKISEESFMKKVSWVKELKLRVSYGESGNNNIPTGQQIQTFQPGISAWINGFDNYLSASKILANPDLKWETTVTQNLGLDYELFGGRVSGSVETYKNVTKDLLQQFLVPGTGYDSQYRNVGEIQNTGVETSINLAVIDKKDYGLDVSFNIGFNQNKITSLGEMEDFTYSSGWASTAIGGDYQVKVGDALGLMYGYKSDGRYEVSDFDYIGGAYVLKEGVVNTTATVLGINSPVPGSMKFKDLNGDGKVDLEDQTVIGKANPLHTGGMVINANAYGFDMSAAFNWSYGNDIYNASKVESTTAVANNGAGQYRNLYTTVGDGVRWTNLDPTTGQLVTDPTALAALNANTTLWSPYMNNYIFSDWAVEDGSFLRLNTLTLGYTLNNKVIEKTGISKLRFYLTANNVFILTNYSGLDPEVSTRRKTNFTPGVDYSPYPRSRQFVFGLNLNF